MAERASPSTSSTPGWWVISQGRSATPVFCPRANRAELPQRLRSLEHCQPRLFDALIQVRGWGGWIPMMSRSSTFGDTPD